MPDVITERDVPLKGELRVATGTIITDLARDLARDRGINIIEVPKKEFKAASSPEGTVAIGSDHGGFEMKELLKPIFSELRIQLADVGVHEAKAVDYPDIAEKVCEAILNGQASRGVIIDGAGIGSAMVANKMPGIRAALCYDRASARNSREHNDSNVLTLGGRLLTHSQAADVLRVWLATPFAGGRHAERVKKITSIEQRYANWKPRN